MITKGIILNINSDNTCEVHVPLFDTAGIPDRSIVTATFAITPGIYNSYAPNDVVYVGFENNEVSAAFIIGKLYVSPTSEDSRNVGAIIGNSLKIIDKVTLPINTTIGNISANDLANLNNTIRSLTDKLETKAEAETFSTNEQIIGTWLNNKVLYRKVYTITPDPAITGGSFNRFFSIADLGYDNIWLDLNHTIQVGNTYSLNSYTYPGGTDFFNCYINTSENKLYYRGYAPDAVKKFIITVEYTKK